MDIRPARTVADVEAAADVLDGPPRADATEAFLADPRHHLLLAWEGGAVAGMVSGVEMTHPDKGTEMFLYELGVAEEARGRGVGRALTEALRDLATERGCYAMWVMTERDNVAALRTYEGSGATRLDDSAYLEWRL
jgi:ribosomal protein S18 acetylase RimI-like enzyme